MKPSDHRCMVCRHGVSEWLLGRVRVVVRVRVWVRVVVRVGVGVRVRVGVGVRVRVGLGLEDLMAPRVPDGRIELRHRSYLQTW